MNIENNVFYLQVAFFFPQNTNFSIVKFAGIIQEEFQAMFKNEPTIMPLPDDAPKEIPRCVFKNDSGAELSFGMSRMDFKTTIKDAELWKNNMEVMAYIFSKLCRNFEIGIERIGCVVQANPNKECIEEISKYVDIPNFQNSNEKMINWVDKNEIDGVKINSVINIRINENDIKFPHIVVIDVNTQKEYPLSQDEKELEKVINVLLNEIEARIKDVF